MRGVFWWHASICLGDLTCALRYCKFLAIDSMEPWPPLSHSSRVAQVFNELLMLLIQSSFFFMCAAWSVDKRYVRGPFMSRVTILPRICEQSHRANIISFMSKADENLRRPICLKHE